MERMSSASSSSTVHLIFASCDRYTRKTSCQTERRVHELTAVARDAGETSKFGLFHARPVTVSPPNHCPHPCPLRGKDLDRAAEPDLGGDGAE
jgi:hypothetical protein